MNYKKLSLFLCLPVAVLGACTPQDSDTEMTDDSMEQSSSMTEDDTAMQQQQMMDDQQQGVAQMQMMMNDPFIRGAIKQQMMQEGVTAGEVRDDCESVAFFIGGEQEVAADASLSSEQRAEAEARAEQMEELRVTICDIADAVGDNGTLSNAQLETVVEARMSLATIAADSFSNTGIRMQGQQ